MRFNTRIFTVALIPLYGYIILQVYAILQSHFQYAIDEPVAVLMVCVGLIAAAAFSALPVKKFHLLGAFCYVLIGGIGIYFGLIRESLNWPMLIASAFVIAFGVAFYEMVEHHRELWHEQD